MITQSKAFELRTFLHVVEFSVFYKDKRNAKLIEALKLRVPVVLLCFDLKLGTLFLRSKVLNVYTSNIKKLPQHRLCVSNKDVSDILSYCKM